MNTIAYLMAPCRGHDGESVLPEVKWDNVQKALVTGWAIRRAFPDLELFIPHEHEEIIDQLWQDGLSGTDIVTSTSKVAAKKDISFCWEGNNGISEGMYREILAVRRAGKPIIYFLDIDEEMKQETALIIAGLKESGD